jgi:FHA domain
VLPSCRRTRIRNTDRVDPVRVDQERSNRASAHDDERQYRGLSIAAALATTLGVVAILALHPVLGPALADALPKLSDPAALSLASAQAGVEKALSKAPALVAASAIGLGLILAAMAARTARAINRWRAERIALGRPPESLPETECVWPAQGFIAIDRPEAAEVPIGAGLIRIGRQDDNEIQLEAGAVHRYHAIVYRTMDAQFFITDVSGDTGNGIRINGERRRKARLANGDMIEVGNERLKFVARPN